MREINSLQHVRFTSQTDGCLKETNKQTIRISTDGRIMYRQTHFVQTDTQKIQGQRWATIYIAAYIEKRKKFSRRRQWGFIIFVTSIWRPVQGQNFTLLDMTRTVELIFLWRPSVVVERWMLCWVEWCDYWHWIFLQDVRLLNVLLEDWTLDVDVEERER